MSKRPHGFGLALLALQLFAATPTAGQNPISGMEWMMLNLRESGQPVLPVFDGWIPNEDGSHDLCFGYFNLNLSQTLDVPIGPDNFIEPAIFDGGQPTHFQQVPPGYRRYYCVFTVNVPPDFGDQRVVWTIRVNGQELSVPGHTGVASYMLENLSQPSRGVVAPVVEFVGIPGGEGRGRRGLTAGPVTAKAGVPLPISLSVTPPAEVDAKPWLVLWGKQRGSGTTSFERAEINLAAGESLASTTVTFDEPGEYLLRAQAVSGGRGSFGFHCCWTNAYLQVQVTP